MKGTFQNISYKYIPFAIVTDLQDFFKGNLSEMRQVKAIHDSMKILFNLPGDKITISCAEGSRVYKYVAMSPGVKKVIIGAVVYMPELKRLDLYDYESLDMPLIQWVNKRPIFKNYSDFLDRAGFDKIFSRLINSI